MRRISILFLFSLAFVFIHGQGNLLVNPVRVVFEGTKQNEDLNLTNIGRDTAVYVISFVHYKMNEDGSFVQLEKPDTTYSADKYLRLFPRKVILPPSESQTIRLQLRKPATLKESEYRTHIYFRAEKQNSPLGIKDSRVDSTKMAVRITPVFGISIPVFVRNGLLSNQLTLTQPKLEVINDSVAKCSVTINRTGLKSAYGNLRVEFHPEKSQKIDLGFANGIGVYPEINKRFFSLIIKTPVAMKQGNGKVIIRFMAPNEDGNAEITRTELVYSK
jgi:P pilus assembly chaperone PapD